LEERNRSEESMKDMDGKEICIGDQVIKISYGWRGPKEMTGKVIAIVPKGERIPDGIRQDIKDKKLKFANLLYVSQIDRVIMKVDRAKSCPELFAPRPTNVRISPDRLEE
jgi:hypothetical protein